MFHILTKTNELIQGVYGTWNTWKLGKSPGNTLKFAKSPGKSWNLRKSPGNYLENQLIMSKIMFYFQDHVVVCILLEHHFCRLQIFFRLEWPGCPPQPVVRPSVSPSFHRSVRLSVRPSIGLEIQRKSCKYLEKS